MSSVEELRLGLRELRPREGDAYFYTTDLIAVSQAELIIGVARVKRLPTMFEDVSIVPKGALAGYGHSFHEAGRMSAKYVQRILAGARPKTCRSRTTTRSSLPSISAPPGRIGLAISPSVRLRADTVIE